MNYTFSPHRATLRWSPTFNRFVLPFVLSFLSVLPLTAAGALYAQEAAADAEAEEDTTVDPTEAFLNSFDPSKSFSKLLLPNVAERVGLTKDQTAEVNRLMAERATKLGQASRDQWPDIVRENEAALKAVLTPAQLSLFDVTRTEQKIVLRFSKERWADVLKWIAGELGMQLVMDAPPPGTFTYVDKTEYSPKEALDILCGVLQLKGYTLVRQNENLFLHDLKKGPIPLQLVPKITPLQLPAQSPNDIVQLTMPLGGRASSSALSVAKQFLGPYGSAEIAPSSGYLTVTDTVHALREILPAVLAIPVSTKPSSSPLWADYPLTNVEPAVVKEQIEHFLPTAKPLVNPASRTISFLALPSEQTIIAGIIHRLEAGGDPTREMTFAMYDLSDLTATSQQELAAYSNRLGQSVSSSFYQTRELELGQTIVDGFQKIAPSATITLNPISRQLIVFALPEDQQRIKEAVEQLRKPLTEEEKPQFALYRLQEKGKALSTAEITALKTLIPRGDMTFDAEKGTLLVVAPKEDQEKISQAVEGLNADYLSQDSQKSFVFYMMTGRQLSQFDSLFRAIAETPEMKGVIPVRDAATRRLSIWATKEQHARIQEIVDQITGQMGAANGEGEENAEGEDSIDGPVSAGRSGLYLETVKIEKGNLASYAQVLTSLFSGLEVNIDSVSRSIIVCGAREDVIAARQTIEKLTQGEDFSTKVIPFAGSVSPDALQAFQRSQPLVTIITDQKAKQLILIGPFQGVEQVSKGLEVVLNQEERGTSQTAKTYMPKFVEGSTLTKIVSELFPTLEVSSGENNRIIIRGAVEKVEDAIKTIEGVDIKEEGAVKRSFAAYSVRTMSSVDSSGNPYTPRNLVSDLQKLVPAAKVTYETYGQQIIVWGTEEEHEIIRQAIGNLNEKVTILDQFLRYQIRRADPTLLTSTLQQIYPRLKVQHDAPTNSILVQGNPTTLEEGKALLEMLDPEEPSPFDPTAAVYPFENEPSSAAVSTLRLLAPKARIEVNVLNRCLVVVARPAEHKIIEDAIQKLEGVLSTPEPVLAFYPYEASPTSATLTALTRQFPLARITDMKDDKRLMVIAPPQVQKKVADALGLIAENTKPHDPVLKIYKFREKLDRAFTTTLQSFAPGAKLTLDTANRQLTVVAPQEDIDKIEAQLPMLVDSYADRDVKMIAYTAKGMALETLQSTLAGLHPSVTIKLDTAKKRLLIWGTAAEHAAIAEEIDTINAENDAGAYEGPKVVVYRMDSYRKTLQLSRVVRTMFPNVELIPDPQGQSMMIFATGEEHQQIKEIIDQIDNPENENASVFDRFYRYQIKRAAASLLSSTLAQVYPQLRVTVDSTSNSLLIQGNPSSIESVKQFLEMLDPEEPSPSDPTVVVYPLEHEPSSAALATLRLMAPSARIEVNSLNRSLVVVARPAEHKIIEETIRKIGGALEATEPVLAFYPYQTPPSTVTMSTLASLAPTARITDLKDDKKLMVVALPLVQKKVAEILGLIAENTKENDPVLKIYTFREKLDSAFTATLQTFAPNAKLTLDTANRQLTVVAQPEDIDKIEAQLPTLVDSYADRDRKMIAYTIKGMDLETLQSTLAGLYPSVTIKSDPAKKRLLIWGTAADHATIAEEIDKINAEHQAGPYDGPKIVVYQVEDYRQSLQLTRIVKTMFPDAEVIPELTYYSSYSAREQSVTIFASQEEHQRIAELIEQLENPSNEGTLTLDTFSFGKLDPAAVESTLRAMLPAAVSGSPLTLRQSAPSASYGQTARQTFFRVDPDSRTVSVYAKPKDVERVREGIEQMAKASEERPQVASKVFPLSSPIAVQLARPLQERLPQSTVTVSSPSELIVFGTTDDLAKAEEFLKGVDTAEGAAETRHFAPVTIPSDSLYPRASLIEQLVTSFSPSGGYAYPGASGNQIVLYGTNRMIERMTEYLEACASAKEKEYYQTYPVKNLSVAIVIDMLHRLCPNATITPNGQNRMITVFGSVFVQKQVEEALAQIDVQRTDGNEFEIRYYEIGSLPTSAYGHIYHIVYTYIISQTPQASMIPDIGGRQIVVVATRQEQEAIGQFVENTLKNFEANAPSLEVYRLKSVNLSTVSSVLQSVAPSVAIFPGKRSNEFFAWAIPSDHERLRQTLAQIESIDEDGPQGMVPKIYTLDKLGLELILPRLRESIPTAVVYPLAGNRVIVWGSDAEHRLAAELLGVVAEAFPEQTLAKYTPVHVPLTDLYYFIYRKYSPDAVVYLSETGDLVIRAPQVLQEKIAGEIKQFDVPTAEEARPTAKAYDVSSIPTASLSSVIPNILRVVPEAIFLPTQTPGYFVIYARPEAQKKVADLVAEIVKVQPWLKTRTERYTLKNLSQVGAIELLRPLAPAAVMVPGIEHNQLIVSAKEEEHERIAEALEKAAGQGEGNLVNRIYHLERADLTRAQTALLTLYPTEVRCLVDPLARALTVNASPEYQKKVEDFLAEMDRVDEATQPKVETFSLAGLNPTVVMTPLKSFYATDPDFQVHYDTAYRTLVVRGSQKQINFASALIDRVRTGGLSDPTLTFKTYTMRNPWSFYTIRNVFANQGRDLYMFQDYSTGKLLVMARPEEHQVIDEVLTAMAPEKTQLEIFDLVYVDPTTAYNIISTMLENDGSFVDVQYDASSNRLYVRANAHKLEEIRRFLIEAGEKDLEKKGPISDSTSSQPSVTPISTTPAAVGAPAGGDAAPSVTGSGAMRTIRAGGADLRQAVAEVQKQWSLKNPISVLEQGDSVIQTRSDDSAEQQPAEKPAEGSQPAAEKPAEGSEKPAEPPTGAVERVKKWAAAMSIAPVSGAALMEWVPAEQPAGQPAKDQPVEQPAAEQQEVAPGIYAVMGKDGSLMITSSDTEALEKFQEAVLAEVALQRETQEQAQPQSAADSSGGSAGGGQGEAAGGAASFGDEKNVRTLARQNVEAARAKLVMEDKNFSVYKVEEVSVDILLSRLTYYMADRINPPQSAFTPSASSLARGITMKTISSGPRLTFTPDRVLNTIMVKGNKVDRDEAGAMITLLDRPELFPQPITKPFKVPVKNTTVQKMATQVLNAFQQKFITMRLPGNQVPRVSPNTETNTLEIYAPESLAMEIAEYVKETDEEILRDPNRKQVQVVKLQHINSSVLQKYLTSLRASQYQYNFTTPYMFNPNSYYRRVPGQ